MNDDPASVSSNTLLQYLRSCADLAEAPGEDQDGLAYVSPSKVRDAVAEIERLTRGMNGQADVIVQAQRELAAALIRVDELERANVGLATESERRRAALEELRDEIEAVMHGEHGADWADHFTPLFNLIRRAKALSGEPGSAHETECGLCASGMNSFTDPDTGTRIHARNGTVTPCSAQKAAETYSRQAPIARVKVAPDRCYTVELYAPGLPPGDHDLYCEPEAVAPMMREKRAYYETHDPPHCPTCSCGLPREDACSCGRVELKDGYVRASCADGSVHTKAGCNSPSNGEG